MMNLNVAKTREVVKAFANEVFVSAGHTATTNTDDISAAVTAIAGFIEGNTGAINNALPVPFKSTATVAQKRHLVGLVAAKLAGIV